MGSGCIRLCGESQQSAAGSLEDLGVWGVGDLSETCVLDYWLGAWGLVGSGA